MNQIIKKPRVKLAFLNGIKSSCPLKKKREALLKRMSRKGLTYLLLGASGLSYGIIKSSSGNLLFPGLMSCRIMVTFCFISRFNLSFPWKRREDFFLPSLFLPFLLMAWFSWLLSGVYLLLKRSNN